MGDVGEVKEGIWGKKLPQFNIIQKFCPFSYSVIMKKFLAFDVI